jgi:8-oxo-dGTP pyrophosphatase MutT (NUDIX family)
MGVNESEAGSMEANREPAAGAGGAPAEPLIRVLAAVVRRDGRYLLCQRPRHKRHAGLWEFPGGKLEPGESLLHAARRELAEELELETEHAGDVVYRVHDAGSPFLIEFVPVATRGEPRAVEHEALAWVTLAGEHRWRLATTRSWNGGSRRRGWTGGGVRLRSAAHGIFAGTALRADRRCPGSGSFGGRVLGRPAWKGYMDTGEAADAQGSVLPAVAI